MITIINKTKLMKTYELDCAIPVKGAKPVNIKPHVDPKTKKPVKMGGQKVQTERVLTLQKGEKRENLPDAVAQSKSIVNAKKRGEILVKQQKPAKSVKAQGSEAQPEAASKKK